MSTAPPAPAPAPRPPAPPNEVVVVSHSNLFYWWPVWAVAFIMAILTWIDGHRMAVVPSGTQAVAKGDNKAGAYQLPDGKDVEHVKKDDPKSAAVDPEVRMARSKNFGVVFCFTLLLVILITNVPLRGMWSVVVIITTVLLVIILWLADQWERIFAILGRLDIHINMGGYLFIGCGLFLIWLVTLLFFDRQVYIIFTPGQFKVCTEIGGGEKVFDTVGMKLERQKGDLFRHYILGLGSGDMTVRTTGAAAEHYDLPNVLFINKKVQQIEDLLKTKQVDVTR